MKPSNVGKDLNNKLIIAVRSLDLKTVERLLDFGADISCRDRFGCTPVYYACAGGYVEILRALVGRGADINADCKGKPLHIATRYGRLKVVRYLLEAKADVKAVEGDGSTALHQVFCKEVATLLLQYGSDTRQVDNHGMTALHCACMRNQLSVVKVLLSYGARIDQACSLMNTPLHYAVMQNSDDTVRFLLESKANINLRNILGATPLNLASRLDNNKVIIQLLLAHGADINCTDNEGKSALHFINGADCASAVELLLQKGADVNSKSVELITPLHYAALEGDCEIVKLLLERGAEINSKCQKLMTPLHCAVQEDKCKNITLLLERGAEINSENKFGLAPLHHACFHGRERAIDILIKYGVNINSIAGGRTGLHWASNHGYFSVVKYLLENGADINIVCSKGKTALDYARSGGLDINERTNYSSCRSILEMQIIKLRCLNYYGCYENISFATSSQRVREFHTSCETEASKLKTHILHNKISFYDFLTRNENQLSVYTKNQNIMRAIEECEIKVIYPIYSDMIEKNVKKGQKRLTLLKEGEKCLNELLKYKLPLLFISDLLTYLANDDLINVVASF